MWQKWAPAAYAVGGALLAGAAAGTAYYKRDEIGVGYTWVSDHMKYVGNLWNQAELEERMRKLLEIESSLGVLFHTYVYLLVLIVHRAQRYHRFYTYLPPNPPSYPSLRTFAVLPRQNTPLSTHFVPNCNTLASDEIQAHTGMFDGKLNDGYYELGLSTAQLIRVAVQRHRAAAAAAETLTKAPPSQEEASLGKQPLPPAQEERMYEEPETSVIRTAPGPPDKEALLEVAVEPSTGVQT